MASQKSLDKRYVVQDGGIIITETVEKRLSKEELLREKFGLMTQQQQILKQIEDLKSRFNMLNSSIEEVDKMIGDIPEVVPE